MHSATAAPELSMTLSMVLVGDLLAGWVGRGCGLVIPLVESWWRLWGGVVGRRLLPLVLHTCDLGHFCGMRYPRDEVQVRRWMDAV